MSYLPTQETLTIGGRVFTDLANLKVLYAAITGAVTTYSTGRLENGTTGYQVPGGKTFYVVAISSIASVAGYFTIGYCDNDVGMGSATTPTNDKYIANGVFYYGVAITGGLIQIPVSYSIPAGKYPLISGLNTATNAMCQLFGYEI